LRHVVAGVSGIVAGVSGIVAGVSGMVGRRGRGEG
jgi:hypothetical protein